MSKPVTPAESRFLVDGNGSSKATYRDKSALRRKREPSISRHTRARPSRDYAPKSLAPPAGCSVCAPSVCAVRPEHRRTKEEFAPYGAGAGKPTKQPTESSCHSHLQSRSRGEYQSYGDPFPRCRSHRGVGPRAPLPRDNRRKHAFHFHLTCSAQVAPAIASGAAWLEARPQTLKRFLLPSVYNRQDGTTPLTSPL